VAVSSTQRVIGAVDWGGTWIRVALVASGRIVHRERIPRPDSLPDQYAAVTTLVHRGAAAVGQRPTAVGVGVAGIVQRGLVMTAINLGITTPTDALGALRGELDCPTFLLNDVQATALGLAARWADDLTAVITMGTGIGGAVIDHGRLLTGNGAAGDFGHTIVQIDGPRCPCGGVGCLEALVSGRVLSDAAEDLVARGHSEFLSAILQGGRAVHAGDLQDAAQAGDGRASVVLERSAGTFAAGLRTIVAALDPARIVMAGSLLADDVLFGTLVRRHWNDLRPAWCQTPLVHVADDEDAALLGAASFASGELDAAS
jgi:predicted NBD/HSP70 family sugar kinase